MASLDFYVTAQAGADLLVAAELKLEEISQTMWNLHKSIAARKLAGTRL